MIVDAHLDLAYNAINLGRDLRRTVAEGRQRPEEQSARWRAEAGTLTTTFPELAANGPALVCGTIFILPSGAATTLDGTSYATPAEAADQAWEQLRYYQACERDGLIQIVRSAADLAAAEHAKTPSLVLLMEGADGLRTPADLADWHAAGLRWLGPAWQGTRYAGGTNAPGPLTPLGRELIDTMNTLGVALDASHLAEDSFWEALERCTTPVAASHANCRALLGADPGERYLSDAMIKALVAHDGVVGIVLFNEMLVKDWDGSKGSVTLDAVVRHIDHVCTLAGSTSHVAIGSDLDGGFGANHIPAEIDTWRDIATIGEALARRNWSDAAIAAVLGGNWRRWLGRVFA